jgi:thiamine pyrophosphate-dependent acetolactate synthase large subunit-like protein
MRMRIGDSGSFRRGSVAAVCIAGALLLGGCAGKHAQADPSQQRQAQQQALDRARGLCRDFGYAPGTMEFARCAQSEYDRAWQAAPSQAAAPAQVVVPTPVVTPQAAAPPTMQAAPQASAPQPAPQASDSDDWLVNWLRRPNVCRTATCSGGW